VQSHVLMFHYMHMLSHTSSFMIFAPSTWRTYLSTTASAPGYVNTSTFGCIGSTSTSTCAATSTPRRTGSTLTTMCTATTRLPVAQLYFSYVVHRDYSTPGRTSSTSAMLCATTTHFTATPTLPRLRRCRCFRPATYQGEYPR
jgi:hypothetical protein